MSTSPRTTRDQLQRIVDILRRSLRHWWLVGLITLVGAGLSVLFALRQKHRYESETVLLYQERISQSVLQGREVHQSSRKMSSKYREMLLSRNSLANIVEEFELYPEVVEKEGSIAAAELLRKNVRFRDRGAGTFRISYQGESPEEAQKVTARLAGLLKEQDSVIRREQAEQTKAFLEQEKSRAESGLNQAEAKLATFLTAHPEFVEDKVNSSESVGASIRAAQENKKKQPAGDPQLNALERQRRRVKARLENPDKPLVVAPVRKKPQRESAAVKAASRDVRSAEAELNDKLARFTPKHPDVISAQNALAEAKRRLARVQADEAPTPAPEPVVSPVKSPADKAELQKELDRLNKAIANYKARKAGGSNASTGNELAEELVTLETEHNRLSRIVEQGRKRLESLEQRVFTADITASSQFAEAAQLMVIDEAFLPAHPIGKGRKLVAIAGTLVFCVLGVGLAIGLGLIDDRIYRRQDLDELGIAPVLVVVPKAKKRSRG